MSREHYFRMKAGVDEIKAARVVQGTLEEQVERCVKSGVIMDDEIDRVELALATINLVLSRCEGIMVEAFEQAKTQVEE
jgi:hypothetical protein